MILVVVAHPDDETLGVGGTLAGLTSPYDLGNFVTGIPPKAAVWVACQNWVGRTDRDWEMDLTNATGSVVPANPGYYSFHRVSYVACAAAARSGVFMDHEDQPVFRYVFK